MADETDGLVLPVGVTDKKFIQAIARMEARAAKMEGETTKSFTGVSKSAKKAFDDIDKSASGMSKNTKASLQNVGFQIQDIIVQIAGGQGVARAFSQQLPQLLGGLGLVGVAAGIAAPLLVSLASAMIGSGNSAEDTEKQMKSLAQAIDALEAANKKASQSMTDLRAEFGPMAGQAKELYDAQVKIAQINLEKSLTTAVSNLKKGMFAGAGDNTAAEWQKMADEYQRLQNAAAGFARIQDEGGDIIGMSTATQNLTAFTNANQKAVQAIVNMSDAFGVSYQEAGKLLSMVAQVGEETSTMDKADALANLREAMVDLLVKSGKSNDEAVTLVSNLSEVELTAIRAGAVNMSGNISAGADQAKRLADELSRALSNAASLATQGLDQLKVAEINNKYRKDPVGRAGALAELQWQNQVGTPAGGSERTDAVLQKQEATYIGTARAVAALNEQTRLADEADRKAAQAADKAAKAADRKAKSDAKAADSAQAKYDKAIISLQGSTDAVTQQIAAYESLNLAGGNIETQLTAITEKQKLLTAAAKAGIDLTPEQIAQADQLSQTYADQVAELDRLKSVASSGKNAMNDLFGSMLDGAGSAKEAVANLLKEIAKVQFSKGAMSLLGMTSWGSGLVSGIGSLLTANAKGGVYDSPSLSAYSGSVVSSPTLFKFAKGGSLGLMGEAGSEAILPLSRMANGELGVKAQGDSRTSTAHITIDVTGAKGNTEIQQMVAQGVSQGLSAYDKRLPGRVQQISNNPRKR